MVHGADPLGRPNEEPRFRPSPYVVSLATTMPGEAAPKWARAWCYPGSGAEKEPAYCVKECNAQMGFFRLESSGNLLLTDLPRDFYIDACKAEFARVAPPDPARGPPLRERLKPDEPFCYGRDYDAAHLKAYPEQVTTSIRLFRGATEIKSYAAMSFGREGWPREAELMMTATTRKDRVP